MTYQDIKLSKVENVGLLDRVNRMLAAVSLIAVAVLFAAIPASAVASLVAFGTYAGLTAAIGWDPLYALVQALQGRVSAPAAALPEYGSTVEERSAEDYKKAA